MDNFFKNTHATVKFFLFALLCLVIVPSQSLVLAFTRGPKAYILPSLWQSGVCKIFGIKVSVKGEPNISSQTIFMGNHLSYLDIPAIGSFLKASFVAKKDVASWPVFGFLSKLQQTAFISRSKYDAQREKNALGNMLSEGKSLIIFPEGTSTDGTEILPFKSSLFSLALNEGHEDLLIQPFSVEMKLIDSQQPDKQEIRDLYSWHRNMDTELPAHLWEFARTKGAHIEISFYTPRKASDFESRKTLAKACYEDVCKGLGMEPVSEDSSAAPLEIPEKNNEEVVAK